MKKKKGFALASTMAVMVLFLTLSGLVFTLATLNASSADKSKRDLMIRTETLQICQNFCDLPLQEFETTLETDFTCFTVNDLLVYEKSNLRLEISEINSSVKLIIKEDRKLLADITKTNEIVDKKIFI